MVDVIVPTWNKKQLLSKCLHHLRNQSITHNVVVVDNASTDGSKELVERVFPDVRVLALHENVGFGTAVNRGVEASDGELIVVINNDVFCSSHFIERIVTPFEDDKIGMVAGCLLREDGITIDSAGLEIDRTFAAWNRLSGQDHKVAIENAGHSLLGPSGGAAAYRRTAFNDVSGFDEHLFMYMEDVDIAIRLRLAGWACRGAPSATAIHIGGATVGIRSSLQRYHYGFSRSYMLHKYGVLKRLLPLMRAILTEAIVVTVDCVVQRDLVGVRGRIDGWREAGKAVSNAPSEMCANISLLDSFRRRFSSYSER